MDSIKFVCESVFQMGFLITLALLGVYLAVSPLYGHLLQTPAAEVVVWLRSCAAHLDRQLSAPDGAEVGGGLVRVAAVTTLMTAVSFLVALGLR